MGIINIADIVDVIDIAIDIADIVTDIVDIVNIADIADWMLRTLQWEQVDAYRVLWGCPVTQIMQEQIYLVEKQNYKTVKNY